MELDDEIVSRKRPREESAVQNRRQVKEEPPSKRVRVIPKSDMFQVPLDKSDIAKFNTPLNQHTKNPMNCGVVSTQLLGMISREMSETASSENRPMNFMDIVKYMNKVSTPEYYRLESSSDIDNTLESIRKNLLVGFATMVLITRVSPTGKPMVGHYFVLAKLPNETYYLLDPQIRFSTDINGILTYIEKNKLTNGFIFTVKTASPYTASRFRSDYINYFLPDLLAEGCTIREPVDTKMEVETVEEGPNAMEVEEPETPKRKKAKTKRRSKGEKSKRRIKRQTSKIKIKGLKKRKTTHRRKTGRK